MKTLNIYSALSIVLSLFFSSCSKDDDKVYPVPTAYGEENPIPGFITAAGFTQTSATNLASNSEFGFKFTPKVSGNINSILVSLPVANANCKVTLWDADTHAVIKTIIVNVPTPATEVTKTIDPIPLQKDKTYLLSLYNSKFYYVHTAPGLAEASFPIVSGNIQIDGSAYAFTDTPQTYPGNEYYTGYSGDLSFKFQRTQ